MSPETSLPAVDPMHLVRASRPLRVITALIAVSLVGAALILGLTPWRQTAPGRGRVIAFSPAERRQNIEAPIEGRVLSWSVREGSRVKAGDVIVELTDNDPNILARLQTERDAVVARIDANRARTASIEARVATLTASRANAIVAADSRIKMARQRVLSAEQARTAAQAAFQTAELNEKRQKALQEKGLAATRQLELAELEETKTQTEVERATVALNAARDEEAALTADRMRVETDASAALNDALAGRAVAEAEIANAAAELARLEVRLARQSTQTVRALVPGTILRIIANGQSGEIVKAGDVLATLVPDTEDRAAEILINGNDLPLVTEGAPVRLQFEGWPALQFSGWPSVAVGTFGGTVTLIDAADDGNGNFRVFVKPTEAQPWPDGRWLKQGARVQGWVQLGQVSLGYELWRQFNGFPPSLPKAPAAPGKEKS